MDFQGYYEYQPLQFREFRVLRMHEPSVSDNQPDERLADLHIDLETHKLGDCVFDALSYTWGPSTEDEEEEAKVEIFTTVVRCYPIFCNGRIIRVTRSLRGALRRLRQKEGPAAIQYSADKDLFSSRRKAFRTWADGVCINQEDIVERGHQVSLMAEIYRSANLVFQYLGYDSDQARTALELVVQINHVVHKHYKSMHDSTSLAERGSDVIPQTVYEMLQPGFNAFEMSGFSLPTPEQWWEWLSLVSRPYFRRLWILQEVILAGTERAFIICGGLQLSMASVMSSISTFYSQRWNMTVFGIITRWAKLDNVHIDPARLQRTELWLVKGHPYSDVIGQWDRNETVLCFTLYSLPMSYMAFSEPRDAIYATLGFGTEWQNLDQQLLPIDYSISLSELFCRALKYLILRSKSLDCLSLIPGPEDSHGSKELPSWCPDFTRDRTDRTTLFNRAGIDYGWKAAGDSTPEAPKFQSPLYALQLRGLRCGYIKTSIKLGKYFFDSLKMSCAVIDFLHQTIKGSASEGAIAVLASFHRALVRERGFKTLDPTTISDHDTTTLSALRCSAAWTHDILSNPEKDISLAFLEPTLQQIRELELIAGGSAVCLPHVHCIRKFYTASLEYPEDSKIPRFQKMLELIQPYYDEDSGARLTTNVAIRVRATMPGRDLFLTESGKIGVGSVGLQAGDQVWLLAGAIVPFILRRSAEGQMTLIGETYIDGMMCGEMWPGDEEELETIDLL